MKVKYIQSQEYNKWNDFVDKSPQGSIFCKTWYLKTLGVNFEILVIEENLLIKAGIVLAKNFMNSYSNPMFDKYLGVIFSFESKVTQKVVSKQYKMLSAIVDEVKKFKSFDYHFHPNFKNWIPFFWEDFSQQTRYTYRICYSDKSLESIYSCFHSNLKNDINFSQKNNIKITMDVPMDLFFEIINKTFLRQGSKAPFNKNKIQNYINKLSELNHYRSFSAEDKEGNILAVCGIVFDTNSSFLILNGIDIENHIRGANAMMIYESIKYFKKRSIYYDFEGSMLPGVEQFYRRFGGELTPYMRVWNDNLMNYAKSRIKKRIKKIKYGR
jgi:hypothetical protein